MSDPAEGKQATLPLNSESNNCVMFLPRKKENSRVLHHYT